jgi:hypothetical protein
MTLLILSHAGDKGAEILNKHLIKNEIPCRLIIDRDLVWAKEWLIKISEMGFHSCFKLQNDEVINPDNFEKIYCRLKSFSLSNFRNSEDTSYASMEFQAMISGYLAFMSEKLINPVHPVHLSTPVGNPLVLYDHFIKAGLPVIETYYISSFDKESKLSKFNADMNAINQSTPAILEEPVSDELSWAAFIYGKIIGPLGGLFRNQLNKLQEITQMNVMKVFFQKTINGKWGAIYFTGNLDFSNPEELDCFEESFSVNKQILIS